MPKSYNLIEGLKLFNDPVKLKILLLIENKVTSHKEIAKMCNITSPTVTYHIKQFIDEKVVKISKNKNVKYKINHVKIEKIKTDFYTTIF